MTSDCSVSVSTVSLTEDELVEIIRNHPRGEVRDRAEAIVNLRWKAETLESQLVSVMGRA